MKKEFAFSSVAAYVVLLLPENDDSASGNSPDHGGPVSETEEAGSRILSNIYQDEAFPSAGSGGF